MVSPFPYCGRVSGWNDEHKVVQLVSLLMNSLLNVERKFSNQEF